MIIIIMILMKISMKMIVIMIYRMKNLIVLSCIYLVLALQVWIISMATRAVGRSVVGGSSQAAEMFYWGRPLYL